MQLSASAPLQSMVWNGGNIQAAVSFIFNWVKDDLLCPRAWVNNARNALTGHMLPVRFRDTVVCPLSRLGGCWTLALLLCNLSPSVLLLSAQQRQLACRNWLLIIVSLLCIISLGGWDQTGVLSVSVKLVLKVQYLTHSIWNLLILSVQTSYWVNKVWLTVILLNPVPLS